MAKSQNKRHKVSIVDVAKHAGVGVGTVSRAINNNGNISPETKQKVLQSIKELGYVPNRLAQSLRSQQYKNILFFVDLSIPTFSKIINGIYNRLEEKGYMLSLCSVGSTNILEKVKRFTQNHHYDGIIVAIPSEDDEELNEYLRSLNAPIVTFELNIPGIATGINVDYLASVKTATNYLFSLNHQNIALLCSSKNIPSNREIIEAYKLAYAENNIELQEDLIIPISSSAHDFDANKIIELMPKIRNKKITAILCMHTKFLPELLQIMKSCYISYPEDVSLIAVEDGELTNVLNPSLTYIRRPLLEMGEKVAEILLQYIQHPDQYGLIEPYKIPTEFIIKESCQALT